MPKLVVSESLVDRFFSEPFQSGGDDSHHQGGRQEYQWEPPKGYVDDRGHEDGYRKEKEGEREEVISYGGSRRYDDGGGAGEVDYRGSYNAYGYGDHGTGYGANAKYGSNQWVL